MGKVSLNLILVGADRAGVRFTEAALQRRHRLAAIVELPGEPVVEGWPGVPRLTSLEEALSASDISLLVLATTFERRADAVRSLMKSTPIPFVFVPLLAAKPDLYYEFSLMRSETHLPVLPLMDELDHPALDRLNALLADGRWGRLRWIEWTFPLDAGLTGPHRFLAGWTWTRAFLGDIDTVTATGNQSEGDLPTQVIASLKAPTGVLATVRWMVSAHPGCRLVLETERGTMTASFAEGFSGAATLEWNIDAEGNPTIETVPAAAPESRWLDRWEALTEESAALVWKDAVRQVELAEAVDRSLDKERPVMLDRDEFSEEAAFKSVMTSVGCGLIWFSIVAAILAAAKVPYVAWLVLPLLVAFLLLQTLGWVYRHHDAGRGEPRGTRGHRSATADGS